MSLDFSTIKSITIPEGNVKKIFSGSTLLWGFSKEYQQVEYITFDGNSWIDTGIIPANNSENGGGQTFVDVTIENPVPSNADINIYGSYDGSLYAHNLKYHSYSNSANDLLALYGGTGIAARKVIAQNIDAKLAGRQNGSSLYMATRTNIAGDTGEQGSTGTGGFKSTNSIFIGKCNGNSSGINFIGKIREWLFATGGASSIPSNFVYAENRWVMRLLPVYRISDGEIGMYDTVGNKFYGNMGTGTFGKGPDVTGSMF